MNCCNHNCNQGRNCQARMAKIGRKDYAKEPYPPSQAPRCIKRGKTWKDYTNQFGGLVR